MREEFVAAALALPPAQSAALLRWLGYGDGGASLLIMRLVEQQRRIPAPVRVRLHWSGHQTSGEGMEGR